MAERVLELYYPQTRAYMDRTGAAHNLRQISMKQPTVLTAVTSLRLAAAAHGTHSLHHVRQRMAADYQHTLDGVAATEHLVRWRLRLAAAATDLRTIAATADWVTDADRTHALVHTTYTHMVAGTPLWLRGNEFELATGPTTL